MSSPRIALLLAGSGVYDGSEITETVSCLIHLTRAGATISAFAPNQNQMHTVNHLTGQEVKDETRNVLEESARIMRGKVSDLVQCKASDFDALVVPGGFGAAKNLCNFAVVGAEMTVDPQVERVIQEFRDESKVLGFTCISPVLAAKVLDNVAMTVGCTTESQEWPYASTAAAIEKMGGKHVEKNRTEVVVDEANKVVTAPAYMYAGLPHEIDDSIKSFADAVMKLLS